MIIDYYPVERIHNNVDMFIFPYGFFFLHSFN